MAAKNTLRRLLRLRQLEEEQSRMVLEAMVLERSRLEKAHESADEDRLTGRRYFTVGIDERDGPKQSSGLLIAELATRRQSLIRSRLETANTAVTRGQDDFLQRRVERRQMEVLYETAQQRAESEDARRAQQILDDWYGRSKSF